MAESVNEFQPWLLEKLRNLNTDEDVFAIYITSIVNGDETLEEKRSALDGILSELVKEGEVEECIDEILNKWDACQPKIEQAPKKQPEVEIELAKLLETHTIAATAKKEYTDEEKKIREAILSQYSELSDGEEHGESGEVEVASELVKNTNAADVAAAARERREVARQEAQKKKEKDKEDREKQKQLKQEKKEKRKTQKGERKR